MNTLEEYHRIKEKYFNTKEANLDFRGRNIEVSIELFNDMETLINIIDVMDKRAKMNLNSQYGYQATESLKTNGFRGGFTQLFDYFKTYSNVDIIVMCRMGEKIYKNVDVIEYNEYLRVSKDSDEFIIFNKDKIEWYQIRKHKEDINNCRKVIKEDELGFTIESEVE